MSLIKNSAWNIGGYIVPTLIALPAFGYLARKLGVELFGIYTLAMVIIGYASIFDAGLTRAVVRGVAIKKGEKTEISKVVTSATIAVFILGMFGGGILFFFRENLAALLKITPGHFFDVVRSIQVLSFIVPAFLVTQIFLAELEGSEEFAKLNIQKSIGNSIIAGLPVIFVYFESTLYSAIIAVALSRVFCLFLSYIYVRNRIYFSFAYLSKNELKQLFHFGGWVTVSNVISPVLINMDRFFIAHVMGAAKTSFYTVPNELINRLLIIPGSLGKALFPKLSKINTSDELSAHQKKAYTLMALVCFPVTMTIFIFSKEILSFWMGSAYGEQPSEILRIMVIGFLINSFSQIPFANIQAMGKAKYTAIIHCFEFLPYIGVLYLVSIKYGLIGVAFAWLFRIIADYILLEVMSYRCNKKILAIRN